MTFRIRLLRLLFWTAGVVTALGLAGYTWEFLAERRDRAAFPAPGRLVDVGGYRLHLDVQGEGHVGPTVVLDAAAYSFSPSWTWVQRDLAPFATIVAYDRPGLGWSDLPPTPRGAAEMVEDLRLALKHLNLPGPYVLVGHSMGSLFVRTFARRHPGEVLERVPLTVLSGTELEGWTPESRRRFVAIHRTMARTLARGGQVRTVQGAGHASIVTDCRYAPSVVKAVRDVLTGVPALTR